jgi:hypothetical protein
VELMKLKLAEGLSLPLETVTEKLAWLGRTGSGKTYGALKLAELMLDAGAQIGALDPVGVWRALRVPAVKGGTSYEVVVFGGLYGDLPLEPTAGELIADLVCDRGISFVLDVSQLIPTEQQRFVQAFGARFFHRKKSAPSAVHLFMEECQEFLPENPSGQEATTLGVMQRLWKLGRNFGIGGSLISQRPQEIAKKALNMSGTLFAFQMTGPQERKAVKLWVADHGVAVDIQSVLQKLDVGQPHVESPMFLEVSKTIKILPRVTADLSSTPKFIGAAVSAAAKRPLTPIDVEKLKASMAATIEKAEASDPSKLRARLKALEDAHAKLKVHAAHLELGVPAKGQKTTKAGEERAAKIAELKLELARHRRALEAAMKIVVKIKAIDFNLEAPEDQAALTQAIAAAVKQVTGPIEKRVTGLASRVEGFKQAAAAAQKEIEALLDEKIDLAIRVEKREPFDVSAVPTPKPPRRAAAPPPDGAVDRYQADVLTALARLHALGLESLPKPHVAALANKSTRSSTWDGKLADLARKGLIAYTGDGGVKATPEGLAAVPEQEAATGAELLDGYRSILSNYQRALLEPLIAIARNGGESLTREQWAEAAGKSRTSSTFDGESAAMRAIGVVDIESGGRVKLSERIARFL